MVIHEVYGDCIFFSNTDSKNGQRVDEKIILNIWINLINYNTTKSMLYSNH